MGGSFAVCYIAKTALKIAVPVGPAIVDICLAGLDLSQGNMFSAGSNIASAALEIGTFGHAGIFKDIIKQSAEQRKIMAAAGVLPYDDAWKEAVSILFDKF